VAEKLEVQMMEIRKRVLGVEHPDTLTSVINLALTWKATWRRNEGCETHEVMRTVRLVPLH